jgi:hypothetical protein
MHARLRSWREDLVGKDNSRLKMDKISLAPVQLTS